MRDNLDAWRAALGRACYFAYCDQFGPRHVVELVGARRVVARAGADTPEQAAVEATQALLKRLERATLEAGEAETRLLARGIEHVRAALEVLGLGALSDKGALSDSGT